MADAADPSVDDLGDAGAHVQAALRLLYAGQPHAAAAHSARAVELAPNDPDVSMIHVSALEAAGRADEAWPLAERIVAAGRVTAHFVATYAKLAPRFGHAGRALAVVE